MGLVRTVVPPGLFILTDVGNLREKSSSVDSCRGLFCPHGLTNASPCCRGRRGDPEVFERTYRRTLQIPSKGKKGFPSLATRQSIVYIRSMKHIIDPEGLRLPIKLDTTSNGEFAPVPLEPYHEAALAHAPACVRDNPRPPGPGP